MDSKDNGAACRQPKKLRRIKESDLPKIQEFLLMACFTDESYERTQKQIFCSYMPTLIMFRNEYQFSFPKMAELINECGMKLSVSSVRAYYTEFLACSEQEYRQETAAQKQFYEMLRMVLKNYAHLPPMEIAQLISDNMV